MTQQDTHEPDADRSSGATAVRTKPAPPKVDRLPPWKLLLHNDDVNDMLDVTETIVELTTLNRQEAPHGHRGAGIGVS